MKTKTLLAIFVALGLLVACTQQITHPTHPIDIALENAKTKADHEALAAHYEQTAEEMRQKEGEHKKILDDFLTHKHKYSKLAVRGFEGHCKKLIRIYGEAVVSNLDMAKLHRELAVETK